MPEVPDIPKGTALAFDFGEVRIGVATGDAETAMAHPVATVSGEGNEAKFSAIGRLIREWQPAYLVVGLPMHTDGGEHEMTRLARKFGRRLHERFKLPVFWVDERLSSIHAESLLAEAQVFGRKRKAVLDQMAAQAILQGLFDGGALEWYNGRTQAASCLSEKECQGKDYDGIV